MKPTLRLSNDNLAEALLELGGFLRLDPHWHGPDTESTSDRAIVCAVKLITSEEARSFGLLDVSPDEDGGICVGLGFGPNPREQPFVEVAIEASGQVTLLTDVVPDDTLPYGPLTIDEAIQKIGEANIQPIRN